MKIPLQVFYVGASQKLITAINLTFGVCVVLFDKDSPFSVNQIKYFIQHN